MAKLDYFTGVRGQLSGQRAAYYFRKFFVQNCGQAIMPALGRTYWAIMPALGHAYWAGIMTVLFSIMPAQYACPVCILWKYEFPGYNVKMPCCSRAPGKYARVPRPAMSFCPIIAYNIWYHLVFVHIWEKRIRRTIIMYCNKRCILSRAMIGMIDP